MTTSDRFGITELAETQNNRSVTVNEAIAKLETGAGRFGVVAVGTNAPPGSPTAGQAWVLGSSPTGAWSGKAKNIARYYNSSWLFIPPIEGYQAYDQTADSKYVYDGSAWSADVSSGSSTGKQTIWIPASAMTPATTNGPAAGQVETSSNKVDFSVLDFDATTAEQAWFNIAMPKSWDESTVTFQAWWTTSATDTDGIAVSLAGVSLSDNDALDTAVGTPVVVTDDAQSGALELLVTAESSAVTIAGSPAAGDLCLFRVQRVVSDGNDDMTEDMRLIGIKLFYTTDAGNDA